MTFKGIFKFTFSIMMASLLSACSPKVDFTTESSEVFTHEDIKILNNSDGRNYKWSIGDNHVSSDKEPSLNFPSKGLYFLKLQTENKVGSSDTEIKRIIVKSGGVVVRNGNDTILSDGDSIRVAGHGTFYYVMSYAKSADGSVTTSFNNTNYKQEYYTKGYKPWSITRNASNDLTAADFSVGEYSIPSDFSISWIYNEDGGGLSPIAGPEPTYFRILKTYPFTGNGHNYVHVWFECFFYYFQGPGLGPWPIALEGDLTFKLN
jgi:hypothetical protein